MTSTAVRVALRVRPLTPKEQMSSCSECLTFIPDEPQILIGTDRSFTFDYVFSPETPQKSVYEESVEPLLEKFVEGFNVTILAYGQTGSGKTYSMGTGLDGNLNSENQGIVPRAIHALFASLHKQQRESSRFSYQVYVSFLELYNEDLVDLLNPQKKANGEQTVSIREDKQGNIYWAGVREELVNSPEELLGFLQKGSLCRTTGSTDMNATSSRSHAIFSVILKQQRLDESWNDSPTPPVSPAEEKDDKEEREDDGSQSRSRSRSISRNGSGSEVTRTTSKFHFVDLAGSERLKRTGASGDRAKEGISINAGLLALGNVISALGDETRKATHVPYRDSKLTRLLQDSLGGNSQTLMLACCSPSDSNFMETLNTLKYANRARNIKNRVTVNQDFGGNSVEINQLRAQVQRLKLELNSMRESRGGGGDEIVSSRDYETETRDLKNEIIRLRDRIQETGKELQDVKIERDTLLIERDVGALFPKDGIDEDSEEEIENRVRAHPLIAHYTETIEQLKSELADTQDRLATAEIQAQTPRLAVPPSPSASSSFTLMRNHNFLADLDEEEEMEEELLTPSSRTNRSTLQPGLLTRGRHRRRRRKHPNVLTPSTSATKAVDRLLASTSTVPEIVEPKSQPHLGRRGSTVSALSENTAMTTSDLGIEEEEKFPSLLVRKEVEETIERAKEEIRKGMEFLEVVKPESKKRRSSQAANTEDAPIDLAPSQSPGLKQRRRSSLLLMANAPNKPEFIPSPLPSPAMTDGGDQSEEAAVLIESGDALTEQEGQSLVQGYDGDLLAGVSTLPVPTWTQTPPRAYSQTVSRGNSGTWTDGDQTQSDCSAASTARSNTSTFTPTQLPRDRNYNPQLLRMLHQIQADIAVKEELVAQLERSELEYTCMRAQYEERLNMLQEHLLEVQKQRDLALRRAGFTIRPESSIHLKEKHQVIEVKHLYEAKMKRLLAEIQDLRRKYTQTNTAMQTTRNQNESLLRGLRVNVESLKLEKKRMLKRMKEEAERVREQALANERMIAALRRKEATAIEARKRLEREHELQKQALKKRSEEVVHSNAQLKHLMAVMKRMTMSNMANKNAGAVTSSRGGRKSSPLKNSTTQPAEEVNKPPVHVRALRKKQLLDRAMYQYIAAKQAVNEMEQVIKRREILSQEKAELLAEREITIANEVERCEQSGELFDPEQPLHMDERIELITAEVTYLNARIRALQAEAADFSDMTEPEHRVSRAGKRVSFSEDVVGGHDQWMDVDNLEERYCLSPTAGPDASYEMAVSLVRSLEPDESKRMAEALIEDIVVLRTNEWSKQMNEQTLEKTIQDLRRTLLVMRKTAVDATIHQEKKIKQLEGIVNRSSIYYTDLPTPVDTPVDDIFENGSTIFDKIYEDAINGTLSSVSSDTPLSITIGNDDDYSGYVQSPSPLSTTSSAFKYNRAGRPTQLTSLDLNKINGCSRNSSPDRLIQLAQQKARVSPAESPSLPPPDFEKYLSERENSQAPSGIARSGSISTAESRPKLLHTPKKKLRAEFDDNASDTSSVNGDSPKERSRSGTPSRTSPSPAPTSSTLTRRPASSSSTQSGRDVFRRLSSSHTLASQAKMSKPISNDISLAGLVEDEAGEYEERSLETSRVAVEAN